MDMQENVTRLMTIVCGHYGSGKTNFALNLALRRHTGGGELTLVDLDIVNPYFRSSDYTCFLEEKGIRVIAPGTAGTTLDAPALTPGISAAIRGGGDVIIDAGGDDVGAAALSRFAGEIGERGYEMLYVVNRFRLQTADPADAADLLGEIETASGLKATALVNNSHLSGLTAPADVLEGIAYAHDVSRLTGLPLATSTVPLALAGAPELAGYDLFPVEILVKLPWN